MVKEMLRHDVMMCTIYGLVLFPGPDQLIDVNAVKIFISRNLVPTLLEDILHSLRVGFWDISIAIKEACAEIMPEKTNQ